MSKDPFLSLAKGLLRNEAGRFAQPSRDAAKELAQDSESRAQLIFEAALKAVQETLSHLSIDNIRHPPHGWFDATLARQIAVHVSIRQLGLPSSHYAREFHRSRESVHRALHAVDDRLQTPEFADSHAAIAARAEQLKTQAEEEGAGHYGR